MVSAENHAFSLPVERWLREQVVPIAVAMQDDPGRALPLAQVFLEIHAMHTKRSRTP
ncbi:hypothetical protein [Inquilinus sp. CA228]|uniref:hypothetical protein n=1 Tax=Inquilinus sp. CA228 TaxID=3455609 RepID=UPI003F8D3947